MSKLERYRNSKFNQALIEFEEKFQEWFWRIAAALFVIATLLVMIGWRP